MISIYDLIIIGGGPAGSTMATLMSRKGYEVLLLDKEQFPRPHVGESMLSKSYYLFEDLGVLDEMEKRYRRKPGIVFSNASGSKFTEWNFSKIIENDSNLSFNVNRADFDHLLLKNSQKEGAQVWEKAQVTSVDLEKGDQLIDVSGIRNGSDKFEVQGRFLVDASGQKSFMANLLNSKIPIDRKSNRIAISSHWTNVCFDEQLQRGNIKIVHLDIEDGGWMWMIPVEEDKIGIGLVMSNNFFQRKRKQATGEWIEDFYQEMIGQSDLANHILKQAERDGKVAVSSDYSYQNTQKFGDRFATVGDASAFIDPVFSSGVYIAIKSSYLVADALEQLFTTGETQLFSAVYERIDGAYQIVEQLVNNYYNPEAIPINEMEELRQSTFEQQQTAMQIFYLLLSGEFFETPQKYLETIHYLRDHKKRKHYEHFIRGKKNKERLNTGNNS